VAWVNWASFGRGSHSFVPSFRVEDLDDDAMGPLEYSFTALAQLIRWAAHRDTRRIIAIEASENEVRVTPSRGEQPITKVLERILSNTFLEVHVRDRFFDEERVMKSQVLDSSGSSVFSHDIHLHGANSVDVWVKHEDGRIIDFGSVAFEVEREAAIESVEIAKPFFAPGEPIRATVKVRGVTKYLTLRATLKDTYGRQLDETREVTIGSTGTVNLRFRNDHPLTLCALLYLDLHQSRPGKHPISAEKIDRRIERIWIDLPEKDDYTFCAWYAWDAQPMAYHGLRMLRDLGVDTYAQATGLFDHRDALRNYNTNLTNLSHILQQCHYQYNFIHADQMVAGELAKVKLLILPWSSAISAAEAQAIKKFVRDGGTVLADSYCGVRDDHGRPRAMLADLFGIEQPLTPPELQPSEMVLDRAARTVPESACLTPRDAMNTRPAIPMTPPTWFPVSAAMLITGGAA